MVNAIGAFHDRDTPQRIKKTLCYLNELGQRVNEKIHALERPVRGHDCFKHVKSSTDLLLLHKRP
jgi:hypothetical protein